MKKVDIDGLLALTPDQIEIVFRHCRGEKNNKIAELVGIPESSFYVYMRPIYKLMGVSGWDDLDAEFCLRECFKSGRVRLENDQIQPNLLDRSEVYRMGTDFGVLSNFPNGTST